MSKDSLGISFEMCNFCNLNCKMCGIHLQNRKDCKSGFLSFENWKKGVLSLSKIKGRYIDLVPHWIGEPLLNLDFGKMMLFAFNNNENNKLFHHFQFSTNGLLINKHLDAIKECVSMKNQSENTFYFINISLDAYSDLTFSKIKGKNGLEVVKENIKLLLDIQQNFGYPKLHLSFIIMEENKHEAGLFKEFWVNEFTKRNLPHAVSCRFICEDLNVIYFRRLSNPSDQISANKLHQEIVSSIGVQDNLYNKYPGGGEF